MPGKEFGQSFPDRLVRRRFALMPPRKADNQCVIGILFNRVRSHVESISVCGYLADMANVKSNPLIVRSELAKFCQRTHTYQTDRQAVITLTLGTRDESTLPDLDRSRTPEALRINTPGYYPLACDRLRAHAAWTRLGDLLSRAQLIHIKAHSGLGRSSMP